MEAFFSILYDNVKWIFSGIGVLAISIIFSVSKRKKNIKQKIESGKGSVNYMAGRDINK